VPPPSAKPPCLLEGLAGRGAAPITRFDRQVQNPLCLQKDYNPDGTSTWEGRKVDIFTQFGLIGQQTIADARLIEDEVDKDQVGVIWGIRRPHLALQAGHRLRQRRQLTPWPTFFIQK
jgi:3-oxoacyl-[acyl-carrier-protein] synthase II